MLPRWPDHRGIRPKWPNVNVDLAGALPERTLEAVKGTARPPRPADCFRG
jgi:hypothetical protein